MSDRRERRRELLDLLAGRLSEEERERFEDQLLTDDELFDELADAEDDLVDAFVRGDLEDSDERVLERLVVASARARESAELGAALSAYPTWRRAAAGEVVEGKRSPEPSTARWGRRLLVGFAVLVFVLIVIFSLRQARARDALESRLDALRIELETERERAEDLARRLAREEAENRLMRAPE